MCAAALLRRLAATPYGALVAAATVAATLLALSWVGLALRNASTAEHAAERARTAAGAVLTRDQARIAALNAQLATTTANARHSQRASDTAAAVWRARDRRRAQARPEPPPAAALTPTRPRR